MIDKCKIFTPEKIAIEMLDYLEYKENLYGKKIMENACGDGGILKIIVKRYIEDSLANNISKNKIKKGLESDIYGIEYDKNHYFSCKENLEKIANTYNIKNVKWNILNTNTLESNFKEKFDFVVGNPPYIVYREIPNDIREKIKEKYISCQKGKFDYCYAFIEESLISLKDKGKLAYLIPNSIFKNVFGNNLREFLKSSITNIIDYTSKQLFKEALTSSAIIICNKNINTNYLEYTDIVNNYSFKILKSDLKEKWIFSIPRNKKATRRFGDFFHAAITIATLYNNAFVIKKFEEKERYFKVGEYKLEKDVIRKATSPRKKANNVKEIIIFPYYYKNQKLHRYSEEIFIRNYPEVTRYLKQFDSNLNRRKVDKTCKWFEYGRNQALAHLNCKKLLLSTIVTNELNIYKLEKNEIPYSGIYITSKFGAHLDEAKKILESREFLEYVQSIGINVNGESKRITAKDINEFRF